MDKRSIGIDLGGTTISFIDLYSPERINARRSIPTPKTKDYIVHAIADTVKELLAKTAGTPAAIGLAVAGQIDLAGKSIIFSPNLPFKEEFPLASKIEKAVGLNVVLENDANAAAIGEKVFGDAKGMDDFIVLTLGTGIGSGIYTGGKLLRGHSNAGGEAGHIVINPEGPPCGCGNMGCLEAYASGSAIARMAKEFTGRNMNAKKICEEAIMGNEDAAALLEYAGERLGDGLVTLINIFNPEAIFFTGSLAGAPANYFEPAFTKAWESSFGTMGKGLRLEVSRLKGDSGLLGAAGLV